MLLQQMLPMGAAAAAVVDVIFGTFGPTQFGFVFFLSQSLSLSLSRTHTHTLGLFTCCQVLLGCSRGIFSYFWFGFLCLSLRVQLLHTIDRFHIFVCVFFLFTCRSTFPSFSIFSLSRRFSHCCTFHFDFFSYSFLFINIVLLLCVSFSARHQHYYNLCVCVCVCCVCTVSKFYYAHTHTHVCVLHVRAGEHIKLIYEFSAVKSLKWKCFHKLNTSWKFGILFLGLCCLDLSKGKYSQKVADRVLQIKNER